ncbi:membrane protein insertase YidC [soil metagenome]
MTDIRRTLLWVVFSMSLVLIWDAWQKHQGHPSMFSPAPAKTAAPSTPAPTPVAPVAANGAGTSSVPTASALGGVAATPPVTTPTPAAASATEKIVVTTDVVQATFDTHGGSVIKLELLQQADQNNPDRKVTLFDQTAERVYLAQSGLVNTGGGPALPTHLTNMTVVPGDRTLGSEAKELQIKFESPDVGGVKLVKTYTLKRGDYAIGVRYDVVNDSAAPVSPQLYVQLVRDGNAPPGESSFYSTFTGPAMYTEAAKFQKVPFKDIDKGAASHEKTADNGYVAMVQHYFASAWLLPANTQREFFTRKVDNNLYSIGMLVPLGAIAPGATKALDAQLFAGPQQENQLSTLAPGLELVKDYGWFTILAKPLFWLLVKLHAILGNWGWSIVGLVVCLKIAFFWLNAQAYKSMAKMKAVNPKVMEMRERLKDKPQQMQQEMMRIYREEKVNPLGGCLPIVIQIPFFIALYWVLLSSVEMRNAPWIGWVHDLSAKDPYFILPLLMTASSLLQTWLNPRPPDPVQAKMMWIMQIVLSFMFFYFPAGLVLYWLTNNILSIAQQWAINKRLGVLGK